MNGAGLRRLLATTAMRRVSRSGRSPVGWDGPRPPSRRTYRPDRGEGPGGKRASGVCRGCGECTQARNGKGGTYEYCKACHPGAIPARYTRERVLSAMRRTTGNWLVDLHFRNANPRATADFDVGLALGGRPKRQRAF